MNANQTYRVSGGKLFGAIVLAIVVGAITPIVGMMEMASLMPVVLPSGVFMVFLYCFAGRLPALLYMAVQLTSAAALLNTTFMAIFMAAGTLPALFVMRGIAQKRGFFEQMRLSILAYAAGLVAAVVIAYMTYGGNMIGRLVDALKAQFSLMPDEVFAPFLDAINSAISASSLPGIGSMTMSTYRAQITGVLELMGEAYGQTLPGTLMSGSLLAAVISVVWGNWLLSRRGLATNESYAGMTRWFLPAQATLGLMLIWVVSYILAQTKYSGGETAWLAVNSLLGVVLTIQALSAMDRFFYKRGAPGSRRHLIMALALIGGLLFQTIGFALCSVGAMSALFGSHGALRALINRRKDDHSDSDDET